MATVSKTITAEEFLEMDLGEGTFELIEGEVVEMPQAGPEHGLICGNSSYLFGHYARQSGLGYTMTNDSPVLTRREPDTVRGGDVCFYLREAWPREKVGSGLIPVPPLLVLEVLSPSNRPSDIFEKTVEYLRVGVRMVWLIDPPTRRVIIYRPHEPAPAIYRDGDTIENLPELPGFRAAVSDFFA